MKHQWLAYVVVGLLSIGAGVAIAGLPNNVPVDATITPPTTTQAPEPTVAPTTTSQPDTTEPETTEPETTEPEVTSPETTDPAAAAMLDRDEIAVAAANGANADGAASKMTKQLETLGYVDALPLNGTAIVEFTTVYFADGFEDAALRLADDLDVVADFVAPIDGAPSVPDLPADTELLVYIGRDRV